MFEKFSSLRNLHAAAIESNHQQRGKEARTGCVVSVEQPSATASSHVRTAELHEVFQTEKLAVEEMRKSETQRIKVDIDRGQPL